MTPQKGVFIHLWCQYYHPPEWLRERAFALLPNTLALRYSTESSHDTSQRVTGDLHSALVNKSICSKAPERIPHFAEEVKESIAHVNLAMKMNFPF